METGGNRFAVAAARWRASNRATHRPAPAAITQQTKQTNWMSFSSRQEFGFTFEFESDGRVDGHWLMGGL